VTGICDVRCQETALNLQSVCLYVQFDSQISPLHQIFPNCAPQSTKCSAKHLQVLCKETGKKNKINVTRFENCEFVRP